MNLHRRRANDATTVVALVLTLAASFQGLNSVPSVATAFQPMVHDALGSVGSAWKMRRRPYGWISTSPTGKLASTLTEEEVVASPTNGEATKGKEAIVESTNGDSDSESVGSTTDKHRKPNTLASNIKRQFKPQRGHRDDLPKQAEEIVQENPDVISDEAALSASLYLNPRVEKVSPSVQITWEREAAQIIRMLARVANPSRPFMVGVVGIPGSGKSTSCEVLASFLEDGDAYDDIASSGAGERQDGKQNSPIIMPMDGYHYSLEELAKFDNAEDAIYRRGAPDTFDSEALCRDLERIAFGNEPQVAIPGFDHAMGDPVDGQHLFDRSQHNIVICEGLYLLHDDDGWEYVQKYFDWTIAIDADVDMCIDRLKERNKCIPGYTPEEIELRCDEVDRANALLAQRTAGKYASQIVKSGAVF